MIPCPLARSEMRLLRVEELSLLDRYRELYEIARTRGPVDSFYIARVDYPRNRIRFLYNMDGERFDHPCELPFENGPTSRAIRHGHPVLVGPEDDNRGVAFGNDQRRSLTGFHAPLYGSPCPGALGFFSYQADAFDEETRCFFRYLALRATRLIPGGEATMESSAAERARIREDGRRQAVEAIVGRIRTTLGGVECPHAASVSERLLTEIYELETELSPALPGLSRLPEEDVLLALALAGTGKKEAIAASFAISASTLTRRQRRIAEILGWENDRNIFRLHANTLRTATAEA